jgi:hypothetical protein
VTHEKPSALGLGLAMEGSEVPMCRVFNQAAEGTRTLDLLHGQQSLIAEIRRREHVAQLAQPLRDLLAAEALLLL